MITPSAEALGLYTSLIGEAADPDAMLRSSGDAVARADTAWKTQAARGADTTGAIADFLLISSAHIDALEMHAAARPAMATMLSLLISVDMSKARVADIAARFVRLHVRFFKSCLGLLAAAEASGDKFTLGHARAIVSIEARLLAGAVEAYKAVVDSFSPVEAAAVRGWAEAADAVPVPEHITVDPARPSEALIDMFSRLHALGMG